MEQIKTQSDLYNKLKPALRTKKHEMYLEGFKVVREIDIWNCCKELYWKKSINLSLASMVNDILNTKTDDYEKYMMSIIKQGD
jgi:hypothetical protein